MTRLTDSGSSRSWSAVEPMRSAKTIVTTFRVPVSSVGPALRTGSAGAASEAPQALQKREPDGLSAAQLGQRGESGAPHPLQKRADWGFAWLQLGHFMSLRPRTMADRLAHGQCSGRSLAGRVVEDGHPRPGGRDIMRF